jgi:hypothetical protein
MKDQIWILIFGGIALAAAGFKNASFTDCLLILIIGLLVVILDNIKK